MATTNIREVTIAMRAEGEGLLNALVDELSKLAQEAVNNNFQMQFAHTFNNGLPRL